VAARRHARPRVGPRRTACFAGCGRRPPNSPARTIASQKNTDTEFLRALERCRAGPCRNRCVNRPGAIPPCRTARARHDRSMPVCSSRIGALIPFESRESPILAGSPNPRRRRWRRQDYDNRERGRCRAREAEAVRGPCAWAAHARACPRGRSRASNRARGRSRCAPAGQRAPTARTSGAQRINAGTVAPDEFGGRSRTHPAIVDKETASSVAPSWAVLRLLLGSTSCCAPTWPCEGPRSKRCLRG